ncbi:hypothetical protein J010_04120 [Cryptococcus neoformans]|nr:hypothetical protein C353_04214 [Cryptococcus neoformans var. grubii AD1-83a]OWZ53362.1 hypothetical protein C368_04380 [Cryptococcus neoformans var. grubii 125.91]OXG40008.1 hypothetical protein C359_03928 [Cryptococcus neoformans var. grubii Bt120]OXG48880.1 hypothetical protein C355_04019 [Cryptococcus neoformans var. grubii Th84]OXG56289.1 hypothetical protein C354_04149 [Cryptococcus neoformans var. grubii MW-RSA1955]OXG60116.1 hypothetical protein C352_04151 [Cryptococcus neoformans v
MSNKPTYAAVVSSPPKDTPLTPQHEGEGPSGSSDAPPPYDGHQPKSQPRPTIPSQNHPSIHQHINNANAAEQGGLIAGEWVPPPPQVAKSRALRRFWGAFFWGWVIWIVIGAIIGGGVADAESNRPSKHQDRIGAHQGWMDEAIVPGYDLWNVLADSSPVEITTEEEGIVFVPDLD